MYYLLSWMFLLGQLRLDALLMDTIAGKQSQCPPEVWEQESETCYLYT